LQSGLYKKHKLLKKQVYHAETVSASRLKNTGAVLRRNKLNGSIGAPYETQEHLLSTVFFGERDTHRTWR
jgi:hypothetical protein